MDTFWGMNYKSEFIQGHHEYPENGESREVIHVVIEGEPKKRAASVRGAKSIITRHQRKS